MKSYSEMLKESSTEEIIDAAERHVRNIATLFTIICDELDDLNNSVIYLKERNDKMKF